MRYGDSKLIKILGAGFFNHSFVITLTKTSLQIEDFDKSSQTFEWFNRDLKWFLNFRNIIVDPITEFECTMSDILNNCLMMIAIRYLKL